jgi:hypothetical protein
MMSRPGQEMRMPRIASTPPSSALALCVCVCVCVCVFHFGVSERPPRADPVWRQVGVPLYLLHGVGVPYAALQQTVEIAPNVLQPSPERPHQKPFRSHPWVCRAWCVECVYLETLAEGERSGLSSMSSVLSFLSRASSGGSSCSLLCYAHPLKSVGVNEGGEADKAARTRENVPRRRAW